MISNQVVVETIENFIHASVTCRKSLTQTDRKDLLNLVETYLSKGNGNPKFTKRAIENVSSILKQNAPKFSSSKLPYLVCLVCSLMKGLLNLFGLRISTRLLTRRVYAASLVLQADVYLSKNIRNIREAKVILMGENHCMPLHRELARFILVHFQSCLPKDRLLLEGIDHREIIPSSSYIQLGGWDDSAISERHARNIVKKCELIDKIKKCDCSEIKKLIELLKKFEELENEGNDLTQQRDASLVSAVSQQLYFPGKIFVLAGGDHIVTQKYSALEAIQKQWPDVKIAAIRFKDSAICPQKSERWLNGLKNIV